MKRIIQFYIQRISVSVILTAPFLLAGCSKSFLDVPPQGQQPNEQFWKNEADATKAVNGSR